MEAKRSEMSEHASGIAQVLASLSGVKLVSPLVGTYESPASGEIVITIVSGVPNPSLPQRKVTTDLGLVETVLGLPIPDSNQPKFWIGLHESWMFLTKHRVGFKDCGIRVYMGSADEESSQFLRLEWVAPDVAKDGTEV